MAKIGRLTALKVTRATGAGMYADGGGLYLQVTVNARDGEPAKSWIYRYTLRGRAREMGVGSLLAISLQEARARAAECRRQRLDGIDPIDDRRSQREQAILDAGKAITFKEATSKYIAGHRAGWSNAKHAAQWQSTLATYSYPEIGALSVQAIDTTLVLKILEPIWTTKNETAKRVRGRIELILDWAKVHGYREGENPARWRGHLDKLLPSPRRVRRVKHHEAMPYGEIGEFIERLRGREAISARALGFTIFTAVRTEQTIGARWLEIDIPNKIWTIPAERMKGTRETAREHRVPLSGAALEVLEQMRKVVGGKPEAERYVFPGTPKGKAKFDPRHPLSNMAMLNLLQERMGNEDMTVHGFRSTFRDWAAERTHFPSEVAEMALAHAVGDKVEAAYRRGDMFEHRRRIMADWAKFCTTSKAAAENKVVPFGKKR